MRASVSSRLCVPRFLLLSACVCLARPARAFGDAVSVDYSSERACAAPALDTALANATIYRQVFVWAHDKDVREWTYAPEAPTIGLLSSFEFPSPPDKAALACVGVSYRAAIELPEPLLTLVRLLHIELEIEVTIHKQVCRSGHVLVEHVRVEAPLVDEVEILTRSEATDGLLRSTSHVHLRVPWYAAALENEIAAALRRMVGEKLDAVVKTLCEANGAPRRLLGAPAHAFDHRDTRHALDQRQQAFETASVRTHRDSRHAFATLRRLPQRDAPGFHLHPPEPPERNASLQPPTNKTGALDAAEAFVSAEAAAVSAIVTAMVNASESALGLGAWRKGPVDRPRHLHELSARRIQRAPTHFTLRRTDEIRRGPLTARMDPRPR